MFIGGPVIVFVVWIPIKHLGTPDQRSGNSFYAAGCVNESAGLKYFRTFGSPPHSAARLPLIESFTPAGKKGHDKAVLVGRFDGQWSERHRHC